MSDKRLTIKTLFFVGYLAILVLEVRKGRLCCKSALKLFHSKVGVPYTDYTDFKHCISQYILSTWQGDWNGVVANKPHSVKPIMGAERMNCFVLCPHRTYSSDTSIHLEEGSCTSV